MRTIPLLIATLLSAPFCCAQAAPASEQPAPPPEQAAPAAEEEDRYDEVLALLTTQQEQLDAQQTLINEQRRELSRLKRQMDGMLAAAKLREETLAPTPAEPAIAVTEEPAAPLEEEIVKQVENVVDKPAPATAVASTTTQDESKEAQEDDPTRAILDSLPGAQRVPGTNTVIRWGGFVKTKITQSFDPLEVTDQFLVGTIPTEATVGVEEESDITVSRSRLNFDVREPTEFGLLRGFIEGDFAGLGDTFRLRHAFGQRGNLLVGKTWTGFVDRSASPEEFDIEGLNGRINVRQGQVRFQPRIGRDYELMVSLEDPLPEVTGGSGVSRVPDIVASGRVNFGENIHLRIATLFRQVRAQWDEDPSVTDKELGWALALSGRIDLQRWDRRDNVLFQLNAGRGYGRYVNDLNKTGLFDGVFSENGDLELIDVISGHVSAQHWWGPSRRSNLTLGYVELDNPGFVPDDFYKRTVRISANMIWSPASRIDVATELLWGRRETQDGSTGDALQLQLGLNYLF